MSRSGYSCDIDGLELGRWRAQVASAGRGKRGQAFFRDLVAALDAMPEKRLTKNYLEVDGEVCALGALGRARGIDISDLDSLDYERLGETFGIAHQLAQEVMFENDEPWDTTPEERWRRMRGWAASWLRRTEKP